MATMADLRSGNVPFSTTQAKDVTLNTTTNLKPVPKITYPSYRVTKDTTASKLPEYKVDSRVTNIQGPYIAKAILGTSQINDAYSFSNIGGAKAWLKNTFNLANPNQLFSKTTTSNDYRYFNELQQILDESEKKLNGNEQRYLNQKIDALPLDYRVLYSLIKDNPNSDFRELAYDTLDQGIKVAGELKQKEENKAAAKKEFDTTFTGSRHNLDPSSPYYLPEPVKKQGPPVDPLFTPNIIKVELPDNYQPDTKAYLANQKAADASKKLFDEGGIEAVEKDAKENPPSTTSVPSTSTSTTPDRSGGSFSGGTINVSNGIQTTTQAVRQPIVVDYLSVPGGVYYYNKKTGEVLPFGSDPRIKKAGGLYLPEEYGWYDTTQTAKILNESIKSNVQNLADAYDVLYPKNERPIDLQVTQQIVDKTLLPRYDQSVRADTGPITIPTSTEVYKKGPLPELTALPKITKPVEPLVFQFVQDDKGKIDIKAPAGFAPKTDEEIKQQVDEEIARRKTADEFLYNEKQKQADKEEENRRIAAEKKLNSTEAQRLAEEARKLEEEDRAAAERLRKAQQFEYDSAVDEARRRAYGNSAFAQKQIGEFDERQRAADEAELAEKQKIRTNPMGYAGGFADQAIQTKIPVAKDPEGIANISPRRRRPPIVPANATTDLLPEISGLEFGGN